MNSKPSRYTSLCNYIRRTRRSSRKRSMPRFGRSCFEQLEHRVLLSASPTNADLLYDQATGNVQLDSSEAAGQVITNFVLKNDSAAFLSNNINPFPEAGAGFTPFASELAAPDQISWSDALLLAFGPTWASSPGVGEIHDLGNVFPSGMTETQLNEFLTQRTYVGELGSGVPEFDLIFIAAPVEYSPVVEASAALTVTEGSLVSLDLARFTNQDATDTHTATIDWGDGTSLEVATLAEPSGSNPGTVSGSHTFADNGTFNVTVNVTDDDFETATDVVVITVDNVAPTIMTSSIPGTGVEGTMINFNATASDPGGTNDPLEFSWTITSPDTSTETLAGDSVSYEPANNGTFGASLTVSDDDGGEVVETYTIDVGNVPPSLAADSETVTVDEGQTAVNSGTFSDVGADTVVLSASIGTVIDGGAGTWSWSFFATDGPADNQTVTISADDGDGGIATAVFDMTVDNVTPTISIVSVPATGDTGHELNLNASASDPGGVGDPLTFAWVITRPDGSTLDLTGEATSFTPESAGTYGVDLTVSDDDGGVASQSFSISVTDLVLAISAGADQSASEGSLFLLVPATFTNQDSTDTHNATIDWGDGSPLEDVTLVEPSGGNPGTVLGSHTYVENGSFSVTVSVTDDDSETATDALVVTVDNVAPTITSSSVPATGVEGATLNFNATASDPGGDNDPLEFSWTVTSPDSSTENLIGDSVNLTPVDDGNYSVVLTVSDDDGGKTIESFAIEVNNIPPSLAVDSVAITVGEGQTAINSGTFSDVGADAITLSASVGTVTDNEDGTWGWSFLTTDGPADSQTVTITAEDGDGGVTTTAYELTVHNVAPSITSVSAPATADINRPLSLTALASDPGGEADSLTFSWTITQPGGSVTSLTGASVSFTPTIEGTHSVELTVADDDGGTDNQFIVIEVSDFVPTIEAGENQAATEGSVVALDTAMFTNQDLTDTHMAMIDWGDGTPLENALLTEPSGGNPGALSGNHVYADDDTYTVTIAITDDDGEQASDTLEVTVGNVAPTITTDIADGSILLNTSFLLEPVSFNDLGTLDTHTASIDWGDGTVEILAVTESPFGPSGSTDGVNGTVTAEHVYTTEDVFHVRLTLADDDGASAVTEFDINAHLVIEPPAIVLSGSTGDEADGQSQQFTWNVFSVHDEVDSVNVEIRKNGESIASETAEAGTFTFDELGLGHYSIEISASDASGRVSASSREVDVFDDDVDGPGVFLSGSQGTQFVSDTQEFGWEVTDDSGFSFLTATVTKGGLDIHSTTDSSGSFNFDDYGVGEYLIEVRAADADIDWDGDDRLVVSRRRVTVVEDPLTFPPTIVISGSSGDQQDSQLQQFAWLVSDADADLASVNISVRRDGLEVFTSTEPTGEFNFDNLGIGTFDITVSADDVEGLASSAEQPVIVTDDDIAGPEIVLSGSSGTEQEIDLQQFGWDISDASELTGLSVIVTRDGMDIFTSSQPNGTFNFDSEGPGSFAISVMARDNDSDWTEDSSTSVANRDVFVEPGPLLSTLHVTSFIPTPSGFVAHFNRPVDGSVLNLYVDDPDVVVAGPNGDVAGSFILGDEASELTWIQTGDPLTPGDYLVTIRSGAEAVHGLAGDLLDGNADGVAGDDFARSLTVEESDAVVVSIPDFTRGPGQEVNVPADESGLPVMISQSDGVNSVDFTLRYDPTQLEITGIGRPNSLPDDWIVISNLAVADFTPGVLHVTTFGITTLSGGAADVANIVATVPTSTLFGMSQVVSVDNVVVNAGFIDSFGDSAFHQVSYLGDVDGDSAYTAFDAALIAGVLVGNTTGFAAFDRTDPVILGNVTGTGRLNGLDASWVAQKSVDLDRPQIPRIPSHSPLLAQEQDDLAAFAAKQQRLANEIVFANEALHDDDASKEEMLGEDRWTEAIDSLFNSQLLGV